MEKLFKRHNNIQGIVMELLQSKILLDFFLLFVCVSFFYLKTKF